MNTSSQIKIPKFISIEGNIGAGKTTIIENIQKRVESDKIIFLREPVDLWEKIKDPVDGESILVKFYKDPIKYAFSFQVMAYATRLSMIKNAIKENPGCEVIICERSLDADRNIFAKMLHSDGLIDNIHFQIYNSFYKEYSEDYSLSGIIYIDAKSDVCISRIAKRGRNGESKISIDYIQKCHDFHVKWLDNGEDLSEKCKVTRIDASDNATYDESDDNDIGNKWINQIENFIIGIKNLEE